MNCSGYFHFPCRRNCPCLFLRLSEETKFECRAVNSARK